MKKLVASGVAALSIATGSLAVAALSPLGAASAQTDSGSTTTAEATTTTPAKPGAALSSVLASAVADGTITQAQADAITAKMDAYRAANPAPDHGPRGERGGPGVAGASLDDIAAVIGITADELHTQLESGATLRTIAGDKADAVAAALTDKANARIDEQLAAGKIDDATATSLKAGVAAKVQAMLDGTAPAGGPGGRGDRGPGGPGGERPVPATGGSTTTN